ncbi:replicative DNA helicase [Acinetobacter venetianus]|uniref:replicative DNA helicase n=1 Tax=Acinetobacter venetianus TaxID=52133 RepID=UPI00214FA4A4|nr:replicative DNA helicase [Acinetobacter venetianus]MCR4532482.1 replicative DNA helicase [Acinetobacter venetianus]
MKNQIEIGGVKSSNLSSHATEAAVLVAIATYKQAVEAIPQLREEHFTLQTHQVLFRAMKKLHEQGHDIDSVTVNNAIESLSFDERKGVNEQYIMGLLNDVMGKAVNFESHIRQLKDLWLRREILDSGRKMQIVANDLTNGTAEDALAKANQVLSTIKSTSSNGQAKHIIHAALDVFEEINQIQADKKNGVYKVRGVNTGYIALDNKMGEIGNGDLCVIAARPSMGKTAFSLGITAHISTNLLKPVLFESIEMPEKAIARRLIASIGLVDLSKLKNGEVYGDDWTSVTEAIKAIQEAPLMIKDGEVSIADIKQHARQLKIEYGSVGAIVVDYLQKIITPNLPSTTSETDRISYISNALKQIAMEFECPVFALSQLSRGVESRVDKRPMMSDLRSSGAIEQDADEILFLYRDEYYNKAKSKFPGVVEVNAAKVRDGVVGETFLCCELNYARFSDLRSTQLEALANNNKELIV